jgi:hypothetical protein
VSERIQWSSEHKDPLAIPFQNWTASAPPVDGDAGFSLFNQGGAINSIVSNKDRVYVFSDSATGVFHLERIDVFNTGNSQISITDDAEFNFGGFQGAVASTYGVVYASENGIFFYSFTQQGPQTERLTKLVKDSEVNKYNFENTDFLWDGRRYIYCTLANDNPSNNYVIVYDVELGAIMNFTGWQLARLTRLKEGSDNELYGIGVTEVKIYKLLDGYGDEGMDTNFRVRYRQENNGDPAMLKDAKNAWHEGKLSPTSALKISYNVWDQRNFVTEDAVNYYWFGSEQGIENFGWDHADWDDLIQNGQVLIGEDFIHKFYPLQNFLKYQVEITSSGQIGHEIHMPYMLETTDKYRVQMDNAFPGSSISSGSYVVSDTPFVVD